MNNLSAAEEKLYRKLYIDLLKEARMSYERFERACIDGDTKTMNYEAGIHHGFIEAIVILDKDFDEYEKEKGESI